MPGTTVERATANAVIRIHFDFICDVLLDRRETPVTYTLWMRSQEGSYTEAELMLIGVNSTLADLNEIRWKCCNFENADGNCPEMNSVWSVRLADRTTCR